MSITFDWYENPAPADQEKEKTFHPRIVVNGQTDTKELRRLIQTRCTLNEVDVAAVLDALSQVMGEELAEGKAVHLDGIGYFTPTLGTTEEVVADTPRKSEKIKLKCIRFRSDRKLKESIGLVKVSRLKKIAHSPKLTAADIDKRLKKYFAEREIMQRKDFQRLTGMVRSTAMMHIRRLCKEGKQQNVGQRNLPLYVPAPGQYGKPDDYQPKV